MSKREASHAAGGAPERPRGPRAGRRRLGLALFGLSLLAAPPVLGAQEDAPVAGAYRRPLDFEGLLSGWLGSGLAERVELGPSAGGRPLFGVQLGGPGPDPLAERTTVFLVGGLDGVSLAGSEAVLTIVSSLLDRAESLPPDVTFVAIPWANPDGLLRTFEQGSSGGRNDRRVDDDRDGQVDEDGPDDMDGDGAILDLLIEDPKGPLVLCTDARFLRPASPGDAPRYHRQREGLDDDGDGLFNEDGPGGVELDHNFPLGWSGPWCGFDSGPWPLSEPETRAIAELVLARRTAAFLLLQGNHGRLVGPGGLSTAEPALPLAEDESVYARLAQDLAATGRGSGEWVRLREVDGADHPGSSIDWAYLALGALALELAPWGPRVDHPGGPRRVPREGGLTGERLPQEVGDLTASDREWARWLDDTRGGIGFVDWQPVELERGRQGLVGGWDRWTFVNPPPDVLPRALEGLPEFVIGIARGLPRLEVELHEGVREGRVHRLAVRVHNRGSLPSGMGPEGTGNLVVRLQLGEGMQLVAGQEEHRFGHLPGGGATDVLEWLILAPEDALFGVHVESPWCAPDTREIRL